MRIETIRSTVARSWWYLSAIRQYDEDWNIIIVKFVIVLISYFQPFASMMRIETYSLKKRLISSQHLSAIRQYDEDWNNLKDLYEKVCHSFSHSPVWWGLKLGVWFGWLVIRPFQPFASMMRIETLFLPNDTRVVTCFQPFASMMRIETPKTICAFLSNWLSAIRQYDEDWNLR